MSVNDLNALFGACMLSKLRAPHGYHISKRPQRQRRCPRKGHRAGGGELNPAGTKLLKRFYRNYLVKGDPK
jgi:hypothetical protein